MSDVVMWGLGWEAWLLPVIIFGPGFGFARRCRPKGDESFLGWVIDAAWIGMAITWLNVALVRETGITVRDQAAALIALSGVWFCAGMWWGRGHGRSRSLSLGERLGCVALVLALLILSFWRSNDIARPLHGHWHLEGADQWIHEALPVTADGAKEHGWPDAGAFSVVPTDGRIQLQAEAEAKGRLVLAVQGPVGSQLTVDGQSVVVEASVTVRPEEGAVRRYLDHGVGGLALPVDLKAGETLTLNTTGERVFVLPGADAVWSLHASGVLRFVHYYQLLNQVENQVWAQEMLKDRWATLNQPPGWSPLLTTATVLLVDDMPSAAWLFLWVLGPLPRPGAFAWRNKTHRGFSQ